MKMRYRMARLPSTRAYIDKWFNSTTAKNEVTRGYENQEHSSILLRQTYLLAEGIRPRVQTPAPAPNPTPVAVPNPRLRGDGTEANPLEVLDSDDELVQDLGLNEVQAQRVRR